MAMIKSGDIVQIKTGALEIPREYFNRVGIVNYIFSFLPWAEVRVCEHNSLTHSSLHVRLQDLVKL